MNMEALMQKMLDKKVWAVVGATDNPAKFGNKIYKKLKHYGYEVYAVNPAYETVDGDACYPSLKDLPRKVDCVDVVVGPERAEKVLDEVIEFGIQNIWFQPGTFTPEIIEKSEGAGLDTVYYNCVMVELDRRNNQL
ncbi:CoA-binding protein [Fusibacter paucivorans]|uniref:CoA-binding protein n=2 Tax=Fusibacter paucivorans TaxID=76009 RepID=A0ABS5PW88_9FIRM|nr:CoA-binding protein [Fusibacter paucivorans]MBS7528542.1 CoA-binding protein [Fusibacter paucivorans]